MLPTDVTIDTTVSVRLSCRRTTSPAWRAEYSAAAGAGRQIVIASARAAQIFMPRRLSRRGAGRRVRHGLTEVGEMLTAGAGRPSKMECDGTSAGLYPFST